MKRQEYIARTNRLIHHSITRHTGNQVNFSSYRAPAAYLTPCEASMYPLDASLYQRSNYNTKVMASGNAYSKDEWITVLLWGWSIGILSACLFTYLCKDNGDQMLMNSVKEKITTLFHHSKKCRFEYVLRVQFIWVAVSMSQAIGAQYRRSHGRVLL